jgi:hypothetical protein
MDLKTISNADLAPELERRKGEADLRRQVEQRQKDAKLADVVFTKKNLTDEEKQATWREIGSALAEQHR